jgi:hypothetical protein
MARRNSFWLISPTTRGVVDSGTRRWLTAIDWACLIPSVSSSLAATFALTFFTAFVWNLEQVIDEEGELAKSFNGHYRGSKLFVDLRSQIQSSVGTTENWFWYDLGYTTLGDKF